MDDILFFGACSLLFLGAVIGSIVELQAIRRDRQTQRFIHALLRVRV